MKAAVLTIGTELLNGQVADTNTRLIAERLNNAGIVLSTSLSVPDEQDAILRALTFLFGEADIVITSGGLGPTTDDLTRESIASFFDKKLTPDENLQKTLGVKFKRMMRDMPVENNKQALYLEDSEVIDNPTGTAPGFWLSSEGRTIACFPGVPRELSNMLPIFLSHIGHDARNTSTVIHRLTLSLPESLLDQSFQSFCEEKGVFLGTIARFGQVDLRFSSNSLDKRELESELQTFLAKHEMLRRAIFSDDPTVSPESVVIRLLGEQRLSLSIAESCTGGMISSMLTAVPGASEVFWGGAVSYANEAKNTLLSVPEAVIQKHGAVSFACAAAMCRGIQAQSGTKLALSVTGLAGPGGGTPEKPVGTVFIGFSAPDFKSSFHFRFGGDRNLIRRFTAYRALAILFEYLFFGNLKPELWPSLVDSKNSS